MLSALGITKKDPQSVLFSRLYALVKDPRGWQDVMVLALEAVPPDGALAGSGWDRDKKILDVLLSLCEAQLLPYPSITDATFNLLRATRLRRLGSAGWPLTRRIPAAPRARHPTC